MICIRLFVSHDDIDVVVAIVDEITVVINVADVVVGVVSFDAPAIQVNVIGDSELPFSEP